MGADVGDKMDVCIEKHANPNVMNKDVYIGCAENVYELFGLQQ